MIEEDFRNLKGEGGMSQDRFQLCLWNASVRIATMI
jgi:hypothetical protein